MSTYSKHENQEVNYQLCVHIDCPTFYTPLIGYWSECKYPKIVNLPGLYTYLFVMSSFLFLIFIAIYLNKTAKKYDKNVFKE